MAGVIKHAGWMIVLIIGAINLARGLTHLIARDSAAEAAGISINNAGGTDIIYLFAIIGGVQAILALFYLYAAIFSRNLLPLALVMEVSKTGLNLLIGCCFKPSQAEMVVGSGQDKLQLTLAIAALIILGLTKKARKVQGKIATEK